ncbi:GDYXXLXY domain-containing protein [Yersinia pestis]|uniref:GDYXXLXY domain-containing protein n=2 Tax=Yersinia pestis TaxID=632 RepID=UPI0002679083|nr:GDYXXLXY domain-containing protein [Yersinia pestis]EIQ87733.1 putative membrane protein [Yersinia pestis PY-02]EIR58294.1 putative membrane protein [Yersinia pestis PY-16]
MLKRKWLSIAVIIVALIMVNISIYQKQHLLAKGDIIILELAPVDPRSLMQGDYMALSYALVAPFNEQFNAEQEKCREEPLLLCPESKRRLIVELDDRQRATAARIDQGEPLADNQHYLQYRFKGRAIQIGTDAYFFQEGHAEDYVNARYGEFRVAKDGSALLTHLLDADLQRIENK